MNFLLTLALILILTKLADSLAIKVGLPSVLGSLLVGILVGPAVFGIVQQSEGIHLFAEIGVILLMFLAGLECDLKTLKKYFTPSLIVGLLGVFVPFVSFYIASTIMGFSTMSALFIGLIFGATSLSITIQVLKELHYVKTKEGALVIGAVVLDDIIVIILLNIVLNSSVSAGESKPLWVMLVSNVLFFIFIFAFHKLLMPPILKLFKKMKAPERNLGLGLALCFGFSYLAAFIGMSDIIGAFFAGVIISQTNIGHMLERKVESLTLSLFAPVFFVSIGLNVSFSSLSSNIALIVIFSVLAVITKFVGGYMGARASRFDRDSSAIVGTSLISRGEMALILVSLGLESKLISLDIYGALVLVVIITTILAPVILKTLIQRVVAKREANGLPSTSLDSHEAEHASEPEASSTM
ncbi:cation:proton antiporter [Vagococcus sp. BWB3-3]|uniref:Cation:proton antiporter n=1 Tax=Vagococcus allomyrinae TaxID=2794353 RepID=A0A940PA25_9ENTE|nr:cation:proton antiporter [Vagococcus allomyrinae]MBP1041214.1 cation:proton antiporter [Vagococcus allomyrinae]